MKTLLHIFIFLAITAFTADVVCTYIGKPHSETASKSDDADDDSDPDDSSDPQEEKDGFQGKELFCEAFDLFIFDFIPARKRAHFGEAPTFCEFHLIDPPYSPPELM